LKNRTRDGFSENARATVFKKIHARKRKCTRAKKMDAREGVEEYARAREFARSWSMRFSGEV